MKQTLIITMAFTIFLALACKETLKPITDMQPKVDAFVKVELTTDVSHLSEKEKAMLPSLFEAAEIMDDIFWTQA